MPPLPPAAKTEYDLKKKAALPYVDRARLICNLQLYRCMAKLSATSLTKGKKVDGPLVL